MVKLKSRRPSHGSCSHSFVHHWLQVSFCKGCFFPIAFFIFLYSLALFFRYYILIIMIYLTIIFTLYQWCLKECVLLWLCTIFISIFHYVFFCFSLSHFATFHCYLVGLFRFLFFLQLIFILIQNSRPTYLWKVSKSTHCSPLSSCLSLCLSPLSLKSCP